MCGIFGYIGKRHDASKIVFEGLKTLEYRGYDSWGIASKPLNNQDTKLWVHKEIGKMGLKNNKFESILPQSHLSIGHTRWATHGGVTVENAHPHTDCGARLAVIHNGIVENYQNLKDELLKKGHKFGSETDTEIIPHMLEDYLKSGMDLVTAMKKSFNNLKGLNAVIVLDSITNQLVAAKNGSPLIIGIGDDELFIASDASGILPYTKNVIYLKDGELALINEDVKLSEISSGKNIPAKIERIPWDIEDVNKGNYEHFMIKEIFEQPKIIKNIALNYEEQISKFSKIILESDSVFFIGSGTASFACMAGVNLFAKVAKILANFNYASEFDYLEGFLNKKSLLIALSQSGETIDIVEPINRAKKKNCRIAAITNTLGSTIYRMADDKILLGAGPEKAVASTKAYTAKLSVLFLLAYSLAGEYDKARKILLSTADEVERLLGNNMILRIKKVAERLTKSENVFIIGRGLSYTAALEGALKIKEVSYLHAEGFAGGELKHGTIALIEKGTPCIVLAPNDETHDAIISNAMEIKSRGGYIIGISPKKDEVFDEWIEVKDSTFSAITQVIPMQLLGYYLATLRKLDPDKPRNLAKSVTVK